MKLILELMLTVLLLGLSASFSCEEPHSVSNSTAGTVTEHPDETPGRPEHFIKKPDPSPVKQQACQEPVQQPINPKNAQGVIFDEQTCTYYVLPPKKGFVTMVEGLRNVYIESLCYQAKAQAGFIETRKKNTQKKDYQARPEVLKKLEERILLQEKTYDENIKEIQSTLKLVFRPLSARLDQEYRNLNPNSPFDFKPLPISNITFETIPEIAADLTDYASRLGQDYMAYLPSWSLFIYLKYPLACEQDWKKDLSLIAHFHYSLGQKSGSVKVPYVIKRED